MTYFGQLGGNAIFSTLHLASYNYNITPHLVLQDFLCLFFAPNSWYNIIYGRDG